MNEYHFFADVLNKYSKLTLWVQAITGLGSCAVILGTAYFLKETVAEIMRPLQRKTASDTKNKDHDHS